VKTFIKSSVKVKPDPQYYIRKANRWGDQRDALIESAGLNNDAQPPDSPELREQEHRIAALHAKVLWAISRIPVASRIFDQERQNLPCPTCGIPAGAACGHDAAHQPIMCFKRGRLKP
jgi:hypothetical protein